MFLHETTEASRAVAAHLTGAAIAIIEFPGPIRFAGGVGGEQLWDGPAVLSTQVVPLR